MVYCIADNILCKYGEQTEAVVDALLQDKEAGATDWLVEGYSRFESHCIVSAERALTECGVQGADCNVIFVIATTKGNVELLAQDAADDAISLTRSAERIAQYFDNANTPIVVSNACISGVAALIAAKRLLESGMYETAIVIGGDVQSDFITTGFDCLKAISPLPCKPFDAARQGLNLGEATATMVLSRTASLQNAEHRTLDAEQWILQAGSLHNDANHISGPSRTGEGSYQCLQDVLQNIDTDDLACVSVHGTATLYNDEMESIALHRAGLDTVPISALKGYLGHTLGAAGLVETILTMHAIDRGIILPCKGYETQGTSYALNIANTLRTTDKHSFVKMLSGFGGCNGAVAFVKDEGQRIKDQRLDTELSVVAEVSLDSTSDLVQLYRAQVNDYPKFFKMDTLSRLGFLAVELLLQKLSAEERATIDTQTAIILACSHGSQKNDRDYQRTLNDGFASPALFVYTLPNIVTGEIAIRNKWQGESSMYMLPCETDFWRLLPSLVSTEQQMIVAGWVDCTDANTYEAHVKLLRNINL